MAGNPFNTDELLIALRKAEAAGHPFRGNQYTEGEGGGGSTDAPAPRQFDPNRYSNAPRFGAAGDSKSQAAPSLSGDARKLADDFKAAVDKLNPGLGLVWKVDDLKEWQKKFDAMAKAHAGNPQSAEHVGAQRAWKTLSAACKKAISSAGESGIITADTDKLAKLAGECAKWSKYAESGDSDDLK